jgi:hypothetical protein
MSLIPFEGYKKYTKEEIKLLYEQNNNTNGITDQEKIIIQGLVDGSSVGGTAGVSSFNGRTGAVIPASGDYTKDQVGLGNVNNTTDANKPISTATQTALDTKLEASDIADFETSTELDGRDTDNRNRANHTGTQAISTVTGLQTALDSKTNPTAGEIKTAYESNANTNAFTDAEKTKLATAPNDIQAAIDAAAGSSGGVAGVSSFNSRIGAVVPASGDYSKGDVGLGNVDNTSDANKPISTATQEGLDLKLDIEEGVRVKGNSIVGGGNISESLGDNAQSVFIGDSAGASHGAGTAGSTFIGYESGMNAVQNPSGFWGTTGGLQNVGVGRWTLRRMTDGWFNTAVGANCLMNLTVGKAATGVGHQALRDAVDIKDTSAFGEGALAHLITGAGNIGINLNAGLLSGLGRGGREAFIAGRIATTPKDANNLPTLTEYYVDTDKNTWIGAASGYKISGSNNVAIGADSMFGVEEDVPVAGATANTLTLHENAMDIDAFYTPIVAGAYSFAITSGLGGGSEEGDTYYNGGEAWPDWQASTSVNAGDYRVQSRFNAFKNTSYRWLMVSLATRTTRSTFDETEKAQWRYVCIEYNLSGDHRYYQIGDPVSYTGSTKTAVIDQDGAGWHTVPDTTSRYRYTQPPYRFKTASTHRDYTAYNNVAIGGLSMYSADMQDHCVSMGWNSLSNMSSGRGASAIGSYAFRYLEDGVTPVTDANYSMGFGYSTRYLGDKTHVMGRMNDDFMTHDGVIVNTDSRTKDDFGTVPSNLGTAFIKALPIRYFENKEGGTKKFVMPYAQDVASALTSLGYTPTDFATYIDNSTKPNGADRLSVRPHALLGHTMLALKSTINTVETLDSPIAEFGFTFVPADLPLTIKTFTPTRTGAYVLKISGTATNTGTSTANLTAFTNIGITGNFTSVFAGNGDRATTPSTLVGARGTFADFERTVQLQAGVQYQIQIVFGGNTNLVDAADTLAISLVESGQALIESKLGKISDKATSADVDNAVANKYVDAALLKAREANYGGEGGTAGVSSFNGRTGVVVPAAGDYTKSDIGLGNVDNTSDSGKPISTATQTALDAKLEASDIADFETSTELNARDDANRNRSNHSGSQAISTVTGLQTALDTKLEASDIADFETTTQLNTRDTANRDRANHTGTQAASTISDFNGAADARIVAERSATATYTNKSLSLGTVVIQARGTINAQTGTTYTLTGSDTGKILTLSNASAITVTIPTGLPVGFNCTIMQKGAGAITFATASGVTLFNRQSHTKSAGQRAVCGLLIDVLNEVTLTGDTAS